MNRILYSFSRSAYSTYRLLAFLNCITFCVSVPVLSVKMWVMMPSSSTSEAVRTVAGVSDCKGKGSG